MGHQECVSTLLQFGVKPNTVDIDGHTPLDYTRQTGHKGNLDGHTPQDNTRQTGHKYIIDGYTPLDYRRQTGYKVI